MTDEIKATGYLENLRGVIASFVATREDLLKRRRFASESVAEHIDERLSINAQTLKTLNRALEMAEKELH